MIYFLIMISNNWYGDMQFLHMAQQYWQIEGWFPSVWWSESFRWNKHLKTVHSWRFCSESLQMWVGMRRISSSSSDSEACRISRSVLDSSRLHKEPFLEENTLYLFFLAFLPVAGVFGFVCARRCLLRAGGLHNPLVKTRRCTFAESYLERPPRSCQLLLCAEVSCLLGSWVQMAEWKKWITNFNND